MDTASRRVAFQEWVSRMLVRHLTWAKDGEEGADTCVGKVITPNKISSVHEFVAAARVSRESWVTEWEESNKKLRLRDGLQRYYLL